EDGIRDFHVTGVQTCALPISWAFAYVYMVCQLLSPASFIVLTESALARTWMELLFLSFTCLSGVGLGDVMPLRPMARALVMLEEIGRASGRGRGWRAVEAGA